MKFTPLDYKILGRGKSVSGAGDIFEIACGEVEIIRVLSVSILMS